MITIISDCRSAIQALCNTCTNLSWLGNAMALNKLAYNGIADILAKLAAKENYADHNPMVGAINSLFWDLI